MEANKNCNMLKSGINKIVLKSKNCLREEVHKTRSLKQWSVFEMREESKSSAIFGC